MDNSKTRIIVGQKHLKSKRVDVSGYTTKHGKRVSKYRAHRWKRKHLPRKVILPQHDDNRRFQPPPLPSDGSRNLTQVRADGQHVPDAPEVFELFGEGDPRADAQSIASRRANVAARKKEEARVAAIGAEQSRLRVEYDAEEKRQEAVQRAFTQAEDIVAQENLEKLEAEMAAKREERRQEVQRNIGIAQAYGREERFIRSQQEEENKQIITLLQNLSTLQNEDISQARGDKFMEDIDRLRASNQRFYDGRWKQIVESNEPNSDIKQAQLITLQNEHDRRNDTLNTALTALKSTQVKNPSEYNSILSAIRKGDEDHLQRRELYYLMPEAAFAKAKRKLSKKDRALTNLEKRASTTKYLDELENQVAHAVKVGKWKDSEVKTLRNNIEKAREATFDRAVKDNTAISEEDLAKESDSDIESYIRSTNELSLQARKYKRRASRFEIIEGVFKERRITAEALLTNRQTDEQFRRPRTINALTKYFNKPANLNKRDREQAYKIAEVERLYENNMKLGRDFNDPKKPELDRERARYISDVNAAISRSEYLVGFKSADGKDIKGVLELQRELRKGKQPKMSPQLREWAALHPEVQFGQGVPYDESSVSPELAALGATVDLTQLDERELIESRRDPFARESPDFTLGLFKHTKLQKGNQKEEDSWMTQMYQPELEEIEKRTKESQIMVDRVSKRTHHNKKRKPKRRTKRK